MYQLSAFSPQYSVSSQRPHWCSLVCFIAFLNSSFSARTFGRTFAFFINYIASLERVCLRKLCRYRQVGDQWGMGSGSDNCSFENGGE